MTAHLAGITAAAQPHVLAAVLFGQGLDTLQTTLVLLLVIIGGGGAALLVFAAREVSKGVILLIVVIWMCDVVSDPGFWQGILHAAAAKLFGAA